MACSRRSLRKVICRPSGGQRRCSEPKRRLSAKLWDDLRRSPPITPPPDELVLAVLGRSRGCIGIGVLGGNPPQAIVIVRGSRFLD